MQTIQGWFGQKPDTEPSSSVLAEWQKYEVESAPPSQQAHLLRQMEEGSSSVQGYLARATTGVKGLHTQVSSNVSQYQVPGPRQFAFFAAFLGGGLTMMAIAFFIFLPLVIIRPAKFAVAFSIGSALIMGGFAALRGVRAQAAHMVTKERLPFSACYLGSMAGTLYASLYMHSYILSIVCCALQLVALLYYGLSYFPGGSYGLSIMGNMVKAGLFNCLNMAQKTMFGR